MKRALIFVALAGCGGAAQTTKTDKPVTDGADETKPLDVAAVRDDLTILTDGKSHYIAALIPDPEKDPPSDADLNLFYGDGKTFHSVKVYTAQSDGLKFDIGFDDPRVPVSPVGSVTREHGQMKITCWGTDVELTEVKGEEAKKMIASASFQRRAPRWHPFAIAKDADENYTYVDVSDERGEGKEPKWRLWTGKKGALKEIPVVNFEHDEDWSNATFATKQGNLKAEMVHKQNEGTNFKLSWDGKPALFVVDREKEWKLIFNELKVYPTRTPTPCDLMIN